MIRQSYFSVAGCLRCSIYLLCLLLDSVIIRAEETHKNNIDLSLIDRIRQEAPVWWEKYEERAQRLQGDQHYQNHIEGEGTIGRLNISLKWKTNKSNKLLLEDIENIANGKVKQKSIKVYCENPRYGFVLTRRTGDSPWILADLADLTDQNHFREFNKKYFGIGDLGVRNILITFYRVLLKELVKRKEFRIISCRRIIENSEEELVEFTFDFDNKGIEEEFPFQGGKVILDPQRFWSIRYYEARLAHPAFRGRSIFKVLERGEMEGSFPWPKRIVIDNHFNNLHKVEEYKSDLQVPSTLPSEDEFTLTAYGLPEPAWLAKKSKPWYLWTALAGIVCLGLAALFRWKVRRSKSIAEHS